MLCLRSNRLHQASGLAKPCLRSAQPHHASGSALAQPCCASGSAMLCFRSAWPWHASGSATPCLRSMAQPHLRHFPTCDYPWPWSPGRQQSVALAAILSPQVKSATTPNDLSSHRCQEGGQRLLGCQARPCRAWTAASVQLPHGPRFLPRWPATSRVMCLADPTSETFSFLFALSVSLALSLSPPT